MKKKRNSAGIAFIMGMLSLCACDDSDTKCYKGYSEVGLENGTSICLSHELAGSLNDAEIGSQFFNCDCGLMTRIEEGWVNEDGVILIRTTKKENE